VERENSFSAEARGCVLGDNQNAQRTHERPAPKSR
jgi:hypothetical protein